MVEAGLLKFDPAGAAFLSITATPDTADTRPMVASGSIAVPDSGGAEYLSGTLTEISFLLSATADDTLTLGIVPMWGTALASFDPLVVANIAGEFGASLDDALADGIGFASGRIELSQVPVPAALPLLATALGALAVWRRRRRADHSRNLAAI